MSNRIRRTTAAHLIEDLRIALAEKRPHEQIEAMIQAEYGVAPLKACTGESHINPDGDSCSVCMPRWAFTGETVVVT